MSTKQVKELQPIEAKRVKAFARFFKSYMSVGAVIAAALPIPFAQIGAIPTFEVQRATFSAYTSLFCFLILGFIFYLRHQLARLMFIDFFPLKKWKQVGRIDGVLSGARMISTVGASYLVATLPLLLIASSIICIYNYHYLLEDSLVISKAQLIIRDPNYSGSEAKEIVNQFREATDGRSKVRYAEQILSDLSYTGDIKTSSHILEHYKERIPFGWNLMTWYLGIFITAEAAFILMAIREYLQDLLAMTEIDLIRGNPTPHNDDEFA